MYRGIAWFIDNICTKCSISDTKCEENRIKICIEAEVLREMRKK